MVHSGREAARDNGLLLLLFCKLRRYFSRFIRHCNTATKKNCVSFKKGSSFSAKGAPRATRGHCYSRAYPSITPLVRSQAPFDFRRPGLLSIGLQQHHSRVWAIRVLPYRSCTQKLLINSFSSKKATNHQLFLSPHLRFIQN